MKPEYRLKSRIWWTLFICSLLVCPELKPETTKWNHRNKTSESTKTIKTKTKTTSESSEIVSGVSLVLVVSFFFFFITMISQKYSRNMRTIRITNSLYCHEAVAVISRMNISFLKTNFTCFIFCCEVPRKKFAYAMNLVTSLNASGSNNATRWK